MKSLRSPLWIASFCALIFTFFLYRFLLDAGYQEAESNIKNYVADLNYDLSSDLFNNNNENEFSKRMLKWLLSYPISKYEVYVQGELALEGPKENKKRIADLSCKMVTKILTLKGGIQLGELKACLSDGKIHRAILSSPVFLIVAFVVLMLLFFSAYSSLFGYKKSLKEVITRLKSWREDPVREKLFLEKVDAVTDEIILLVKHGVDSKIELTRAKAALEAEESYSKLIEQAAHDIEGPVEVLRRRLRLIDTIPEEEKEEIRGFLKRILAANKDLLGISKSKVSFEFEKIKELPLKPLVDLLVREKKILHPKISFKIEASSYEKAFFVEETMERVLANLIENSAHALKDTKNPEVRISVNTLDERCFLKVEDNGKGIAKEHLTEVLKEKFTFGKKKGTGMGLYIVDQRVREWGGRVSIESKTGEGTKVTLSLHRVFKNIRGNEYEKSDQDESIKKSSNAYVAESFSSELRH